MLVRSIISIIFKLLLFFIVFVFVGYIISRRVLKQKDNNGKFSVGKTRLFGLFMELDNLSILSISIVLVRFIFLVYSICNRTEIIPIHLYALLFLSLLFGLMSKSIKNLIVDMGSSAALYFALLSSKLLSNYILEVRFTWYIFLGNVLLVLFIILYTIYFLLRNINNVVSRTKYIRRN